MKKLKISFHKTLYEMSISISIDKKISICTCLGDTYTKIKRLNL